MDLAWPWVVAVAPGWPLLELIAWLRRAAGLLIAPSGSVGPETPVANLQAMYRRVRERNAKSAE